MAERGSGRFLPGDPRVSEPYRLTPQLAFRVAILAFLTLSVFAVLFLRLWALQVLSGDTYLAQAKDNRVRTLDIEAPRGEILDRDGHVLVTNVAGTRVELWPADLPKKWPAERSELRALSDITGVTVKDMLASLEKSREDPLTPIVVERGIKQNQVFYLMEHEAQFPGVHLADSWLRKYPYQSLAAQVLGYVGAISPQEYKTLKKKGYLPTDQIGQSGVESAYDSYLRGHDGKAQLTVNSLGQPKGRESLESQPTPGDALKLTIDINLQRAAEKAITYGIHLAHASEEGSHADGGSIVAMNPNTGAILAMASNPTYEPSIFSGTHNAKKLQQLFNDPSAPLLNRAIGGTYPPGSTFKPVTALAAMMEPGPNGGHLLTPGEPLLCSPSFKAYGQTFNNWTNLIDQYMTLEQAIAESCDTFFYQVGERFYQLPPDRGHPLQAWANRFGLGEPTGLDIGGSVDGLMPTPEWRCKAFGGKPPYSGATCDTIDRTWKPGYSIQLAIGQGDLLVTPLQMTRFYAMIANGGKLVTPYVANDVEELGPNGSSAKVLRTFGAQSPQASGVDPGALQVVQAGLNDATHATYGTGYGVFGHFPIDIAGKTGSAEKVVSVPGYPNGLKLTQSWWCGYGPYEDPSIVVCAMIQNGGEGGSAAAPAALKVFEQYFKKNPTLVTQQASD
ncbi:MAG TPA: penicillin-binding protein 2 [Gaiellaceae bacterium]|nr:penicillin-binding protein 2 [Gaiellaceae bacterium]